MRNFGGEIELKGADSYYEHTISGRSSLRLIIESANLQNKSFLVPEYVCDVVLLVLEEFKITYDFYSVDLDLGISLPSNSDDYDVLYIVKYFGGLSTSARIELEEWKKELLVDDVFSPQLDSYDFAANSWFTFNSLRKISPISGFSQIRGSRKLDLPRYHPNELYDDLNYEGKSLKYSYKNGVIIDEDGYLNCFKKAEKILDKDTQITIPASRSIAEAIEFHHKLDQNQKLANINYQFASAIFEKHILQIDSNFRTHVVVQTEYADEVRHILKRDSIFLPKYWRQDIRKHERNIEKNNYLVIPTGYFIKFSELQEACQAIKNICEKIG